MSVQPPHPNTAITQLQAQSSPLCQPSSFSVPKLSFCPLISTIQDGYPRTPSLSQSLCNNMFAFVNVIVNFVITARKRCSLSGPDEKYVYHDNYCVVARVKLFQMDFFSPVQYLFFWSW